MSYSDYGGLCWKFKDGEKPERFKPAEDASLHSEGPGDDRPLEQATGLKFDALLKADPNFGKVEQQTQERAIKLDNEPELDQWLTGHAHHVVIGNMGGIALVNHKGYVKITINGVEMKSCEWDDSDDGPFYHGGVMPTPNSMAEVRWAVQMLTDPCYVSFNWIRYPDGTNYLAVGGYGVGEHWWLDEENNAMEMEGDEWVSKPDATHYPTDSEWLDKLIAWHKELPSKITVYDEALRHP
ncbi:MAG: hypothetical protein WC919_00665 [Candidatus Paceibacterota bacterium]|jgi:hypothetical protein